jgi:hypothetical protein
MTLSTLTRRREARHTARRHAHRRSTHTHSTHGPSSKTSAQIGLIQRVGLSFQVVRVRYAVDNLLCLVAGYLLIVCLHVAEVVAAIVVSFPHAHAVVGEVDIAVVAEELRHSVALGILGEWVRSGAIDVKADSLRARRKS